MNPPREGCSGATYAPLPRTPPPAGVDVDRLAHDLAADRWEEVAPLLALALGIEWHAWGHVRTLLGPEPDPGAIDRFVAAYGRAMRALVSDFARGSR